tara:strand:- start:8272 stop:9405 length:1134 start_codon:yes stop_codon:yes gene_type:complete
MKKILIVFGTRPEAIKMAPLIKEFEQHSNYFNIKICNTGQHKEMLDQVLEIFEIKPHYNINIMNKNQSLSDITSKIIKNFENILLEFQPELVFVHGDTSTTFAASLACFYNNIPVAHVEAGLRSFDLRLPFPEEANRKLTSQIAKYHFAPTELNAKNLVKEGIEEENIIVTGNTVIDALYSTINLIKRTNRELRVKKLLSTHEINLEKKFILVTGHRRESFGEGLQNICAALGEIADKNPSIDIIYPVHLNPNVKNIVDSQLNSFENIKLIPPLDYETFIYLMQKSYFIITDSGGIQEEGPSIGKPVLVTRVSSERPEAINEGVVNLVGYEKNKIVKYAQKLINNESYYIKMSSNTKVYGDGTASQAIVQFCIKNLI